MERAVSLHNMGKKMKISTSIIFAFILSLVLALTVTVSASPATATLAGPGTVRSGDTITLSFNLNGSNLHGVSGTLSYDSEQVTPIATKQKVPAPWVIEFNGNNFIAYDDSLETPVDGHTTIFTATFQVKDLPAGTPVTISLTNVIASEGNTDEEIGTVSYAITISPPPSQENHLKSLMVTNTALSPAFNEKTTTYVTTVPFSTTKLNINAVAKDSKATVTIDNPPLVVDEITAVTITVTAEDGSVKIYTIQVKRQQDPNYIPSGDNTLTDLTVNGYVISPAFKEDISQYIVWLPYETENITVIGTTAHKKATVTVEGGTNLVAGKDNVIKITCIAENKAERVYILIAKRAAPHGSDEPLPTEPLPSEPDPTASTTEPTVDETSPSTITPGTPTDTQDNRVKVMLIVSILIGVLALTMGTMVGIVIGRKTKR